MGLEIFSLKGKLALVTGGGTGIGLGISRAFIEAGARVVITGRRKEILQEVAAKLGPMAEYRVSDVTEMDKIPTLVDDIENNIGPIDILVNNAGIAHIGKADNTSESDFDRIVSVNVKGVYNCLFASIPQLKKNGGGVILNMASVAAWCGLSDRFAYSMAKGAVAAMTLSVAKDYLADHIRCNSLSPARVHTPFVDGFLQKNYPGKEKEMFDNLSKTQPIGRMAEPGEVAALALYLASDEASFITGNDYPFDGGFLKLNT